MASGGSFNRFGGGVGLGNGGNGGSPGMVTSKQGLQAASQGENYVAEKMYFFPLLNLKLRPTSIRSDEK